MGESKEEIKKFDMDWKKNLIELDKAYGFSHIFTAESPETMQEVSVFVLALAFQAFQSVNIT